MAEAVGVGVRVGVDVAAGLQAPRVQTEQDAPDWVVQSREPLGQTTEVQAQLALLPAQSTGWLAPREADEIQLFDEQTQMVVGVGVGGGVKVGPADWTITSWGWLAAASDELYQATLVSGVLMPKLKVPLPEIAEVTLKFTQVFKVAAPGEDRAGPPITGALFQVIPPSFQGPPGAAL